MALLNPLRTRRFAEVDLERAKTDALDALTLARFAAQKRPAATPLTDEALEQLRELVRLRERLLRPIRQVGGTRVLVAEGEACTQSEPQVCRRAARILPLRGGRFFSEAVSGADRSCLGATWFPLSREQALELPNGWRRKFELTSTLTFGAEAITIQEQVAVGHSDPSQPSVAERLFRRAQNERKLTVEENVLVGSAPPLWTRMLEQQLVAGARPLPGSPSSPTTRRRAS